MHSSVFETLAEPTRLRIVEALRGGEHAVNEIVDRVDIHQSGVSRHLRILQEAGFVQVRPDGPKRFYSLRPEPFHEIDAWVAGYRDLWEARLGKFAEELERRRKARATKRETEDHDRANVSGVDRRRLGVVDDEGRHRVVVGPGRFLGEGSQHRPPPWG